MRLKCLLCSRMGTVKLLRTPSTRRNGGTLHFDDDEEGDPPTAGCFWVVERIPAGAPLTAADESRPCEASLAWCQAGLQAGDEEFKAGRWRRAAEAWQWALWTAWSAHADTMPELRVELHMGLAAASLNLGFPRETIAHCSMVMYGELAADAGADQRECCRQLEERAENQMQADWPGDGGCSAVDAADRPSPGTPPPRHEPSSPPVLGGTPEPCLRLGRTDESPMQTKAFPHFPCLTVCQGAGLWDEDAMGELRRCMGR